MRANMDIRDDFLDEVEDVRFIVFPIFNVITEEPKG